MPTAWPELYNSTRWKKIRQIVLEKAPLCAVCRKSGRLTQAEDVDHIVAHQGDEHLFFDIENLQPICKTCHGSKTAQEVRQRSTDTSPTARDVWLRTVQSRPDRVATLHSRGGLAGVKRLGVVACPDIQELPVLLCGSSAMDIDGELVDREGGLLLMKDAQGQGVLAVVGCTNSRELEKVKKSVDFLGIHTHTGYLTVVDDHKLVDGAKYNQWYDKVCVSFRKYNRILA